VVPPTISLDLTPCTLPRTSLSPWSRSEAGCWRSCGAHAATGQSAHLAVVACSSAFIVLARSFARSVLTACEKCEQCEQCEVRSVKCAWTPAMHDNGREGGVGWGAAEGGSACAWAPEVQKYGDA
jgi:hypothetical protein